MTRGEARRSWAGSRRWKGISERDSGFPGRVPWRRGVKPVNDPKGIMKRVFDVFYPPLRVSSMRVHGASACRESRLHLLPNGMRWMVLRPRVGPRAHVCRERPYDGASIGNFTGHWRAVLIDETKGKRKWRHARTAEGHTTRRTEWIIRSMTYAQRIARTIS